MVVESCEENKELGFDDLFQKYISGECSDRDKEFFSKTKELYKTYNLKLSIDIVKGLQIKLKDNGWFQHFKHHLNDVDTWIDFENEIEKVLILLGTLFNIEFEKNSIINFDEDNSSRLDIAKNIIDNDTVLLNKILLDRTGLKSNIINSLLKEFKIFNTMYGVRSQEKYSTQNYFKKVTKDEFDIFQEVTKNVKGLIGLNLYSHKKEAFSEVLNKKYLKRFEDKFLSFNETEIFRQLLIELDEFKHIFENYISSIINNIEPTKSFDTFGDLAKEIDAVYTFNYSNIFERLYPNSLESQLNQVEVQYIHGSAEHKNIVLGISDLDEGKLKKYKIYGFVKTFQKLVSNTDYIFLDNSDVKLTSKPPINYLLQNDYEIIIWGHSLDSSDGEYIREMFNLNSESLLNRVTIRIWYHGSQQLANLMHIMGKDVIQEWMKKGWLVFEAAPDIYQLNQQKQSLLEIA